MTRKKAVRGTDRPAEMPAPAPPPYLRPEQAIVWMVLSEGGSQKEASQACGRSKNTVGAWLKKWRGVYGPQLFLATGRTRGGHNPAKQLRKGLEIDAAEPAMWDTLRTKEARNLGITASQVRNRLLELLPEVGSERVDRGPDGKSAPVVVKGPDSKTISNFSVGIAKLLETAELLDGRPTARSESTATKTSGVDLSALESSAGNPEFTETQAAVEEVWVRFQKNKATAEKKRSNGKAPALAAQTDEDIAVDAILAAHEAKPHDEKDIVEVETE